MAHLSIWVAPLAREITLFAAAWVMSAFFMRVQTGQPYESMLHGLLGIGVLFALLTLLVEVRELFMPRPVAFVGLLLMALFVGFQAGGGLLVSDWFGPRLSLQKRGIVVLPLGLFLLRVYFVLSGVRFAPALDVLRHRKAVNNEWVDKLRRRVSFWME